MANYKIADFVVDFKNKYHHIEKLCEDYKCDETQKSEFVIEVSDLEIEKELANANRKFSKGYLEGICAYRKLCLMLPLYDALLLHGVIISCEDKGIAFVAPSGVGKTTHALLWQKNFTHSAVIINGDKPIIRFFDGVPFAYGTPWSGKEGIQVNGRVELTDICIIERDTQNSATLIEDKSAIINAFMKQFLIPTKPQPAIKTLEMIDLLMRRCKFWSIKCNVSNEAAIIAHNAIINN